MFKFKINEKKVVLGTVGALIGSAAVFGGVVSAGVTTGLFSSLGVGMLLLKVRKKYPRVWNWIINEPLLPDLVISLILATIVGSGTATGIIAAAAAGLFVSAGLCIGKMHLESGLEIVSQ